MFDRTAIAWAICRSGTSENLRELTEYGNAGPIADAVIAALTEAMHKTGASNRRLNAVTLPTPTEDARSRVKVLEEALAAIRDGDVPRPVARQWRADGKPSKLDQCKHDVSVSEDCAGCTAEFVTTALGNKETDRHG